MSKGLLASSGNGSLPDCLLLEFDRHISPSRKERSLALATQEPTRYEISDAMARERNGRLIEVSGFGGGEGEVRGEGQGERQVIYCLRRKVINDAKADYRCQVGGKPSGG